jgi:hypothetical protein
MNKRFFLLILALSAVLLLTPPADAHYVWFDSSGLVSATPEESISVDIYLHADFDDTLYGWGLNIGFDDVNYGGLELEYVSYTYGYETLTAHGTDEGVGYIAGDSNLNPGEGVIHAGRYDWSFTGDLLDSGEDYLLFSVSFTFVDGLWDGDDVWAEWEYSSTNYSYFEMDSGLYDASNTMSVAEGSDYGAPVPIPGAILLLGSGLIGLAGIRQRSM